MNFSRTLVATVLLGLASSVGPGCNRLKTGIDTRPMTDAERVAMMKGAKSPETFGLTVYRSDDGPVFAGAHRMPASRIVTLPFASSERPAPPMFAIERARKSYLYALVDTTSADNWATPAAVRDLRGVPLGAPNGYGRKADHVLDDLGGLLHHVWSLKIAETEMSSALFYVRNAYGPLGPLSRWTQDPRPDLIFGMAALRGFAAAEFDFKRGRISLSSSDPFPIDPERLIASAPMVYEQGALACDGVLEGQPARFLIDVAGDFALALKDPPAAVMKQASIGDLVLRQVDAQSTFDRGMGLDPFPRIGRRVLERFVLTLDFRARKIHLSRPPPAT